MIARADKVAFSRRANFCLELEWQRETKNHKLSNRLTGKPEQFSSGCSVFADFPCGHEFFAKHETQTPTRGLRIVDITWGWLLKFNGEIAVRTNIYFFAFKLDGFELILCCVRFSLLWLGEKFKKFVKINVENSLWARCFFSANYLCCSVADFRSNKCNWCESFILVFKILIAKDKA